MVDVIEAGQHYRVVAPGNLHKGKVIVVTEVRASMAMAYIGESPYPFLPGELEPLVPAEPKPKRATPARRAAVLKELAERVLATQLKLPKELKAELEAAVKL